MKPPEGQTRGAVVVVDDDPAILRVLERQLRTAGYTTRSFDRAAEAIAALEQDADSADAVLCDLQMPEMDGLAFLREARERWPSLTVVMMTGEMSVAPAVEAMKRGAYDYFQKPFDALEEVSSIVARAVERTRLFRTNQLLERQLAGGSPFVGASSAKMRDTLAMVAAAASTDVTVLVLGESGTGKELIARSLHDRSERRAGRFVAVNCSGLSEALLESELFGHVKGAFTGAMSTRRGLFEEAEGGTLFLDEVGELAEGLQARLLRALQEREIRAVGSNESRKVDIRIVAATNRALAAAVSAGTFREDLYYRLNVVRIDMPPLRERAEDIPELAYHFLRKYGARMGRTVTRIDAETLELLVGYRWPGNVRELENMIQRALVTARGEALTPSTLPSEIREIGAPGGKSQAAPFAKAKELAIVGFERRYVERLLTQTRGNVGEGARASGLDKANFRRLLRRHRISPDDYRRQ